MMNQSCRRILSILLCLMTVMSLGAAALADNEPAAIEEPAGGAVLIEEPTLDGDGLYEIHASTGSGQGSVTVDKTSAAADDIITITAIPAEGYEFRDYRVFWRDNMMIDIPVDRDNGTFTMPAHEVWVEAYFFPKEYNLTIADGLQHGSVTVYPNAGEVPVGGGVSVELTPEYGYMPVRAYYVMDSALEQIELEIDRDDGYRRFDAAFIMPAGDVTVYAEFAEMETHTVTVDDGMQNGGLTVSDTAAKPGTTITVLAQPADGYGLSGMYLIREDGTGKEINWYSGDISNGIRHFYMPDEDVTVTAEFGPLRLSFDLEVGEGHDALTEAVAEKLRDDTLRWQGPEIERNGTRLSVVLTNTEGRLYTLADLSQILSMAFSYGPLEDIYVDAGEHFLGVAPDAFDSYGSWDELCEDTASENTTPTEQGHVFHALWDSPVDSVDLTIEPPLCGTRVTSELIDEEDPSLGYRMDKQTPRPKVTVNNDQCEVYAQSDDVFAHWVTNGDTYYEPLVNVTFEGGKAYTADIILRPGFGYFFDTENPPESVIVNGEEVHSIEPFGYTSNLFVMADVVAAHVPGDAVRENEVPAACEKDGSYEEAVYCAGCGTELSRETKPIDALGHDWGEWTETKPATVDEEGAETRVCKNDPTHIENRAVPKLEPAAVSYRNVEGGGAVWTKGSGVSCDFTFKRSENDEVTFSSFLGIRVDGKDVAPSDYEASEGSVAVKLKAAFLEGLSVGEHTLKARFTDGEATAKFTVAAKSGEDSASRKNEKSVPRTGDDRSPALWLALAVFCGAGLVSLGYSARKKHER